MLFRIFMHASLLLACFLLPKISFAQTIELHDIQQNTSNNHYKIGAYDPYIVFLYPEPIQTESTVAEVNISLKGQNFEDSEQSIEIFWASGTEKFNGKNKVKLLLDQPQQKLLVPLELLDSSLTALRFDIDGCQDCLLSIDKPNFKVANMDSPESFHKAFLNLYTLKHGRDIAISEWVGQDLTTVSPGEFSYYGWDPRIINTENLSLPMDRARGVFFDFDYDLSSKVQALELFILFENSKWSPKRTVHFAWIKNNPNQHNHKLFIPFDKFRSNKYLRRIRLDFPACKTCKFTLNQSRLVGIDEAEQYKKYIPERIHYINTELPAKRTIASEFLNKLKIDMPFNLFYIFMLLASVVITVLLFLTSSRREANKTKN